MRYATRSRSDFLLILSCSLGQMGPSGSGKTSLLNVLAQRVPNKYISGNVFIDGKPDSKAFKRRMGFVFQVQSWLTLRDIAFLIHRVDEHAHVRR